MTPLVSKDPKDILNAARCFESCVPMGFQNELKTYLLDNAIIAASPPCVTPISPNNVQVGAFTVTNTSLSVSWNQPKNTGSLITSYTIQMGTTPGGPYPIQQIVGAGKRVVTITGLSQNTTYYAIVTATSFAGCSVTSSEAHGSTSGNGLLAGLIAYWKLDEAGAIASWADATGNGFTGTVAGAASLNSAAGIINNGVNNPGNGQTTAAGIQVSATLDQRVQTSPFSVQLWVNPVFFNVSAGYMGNNQNGVTTNGWLFYTANNGGFHFQNYDDANTLSDLAFTTTLVGLNVWNHIVVVYDGGALGNCHMYLNGVANGAALPIAGNGIARGHHTYMWCNYQNLLAGVPGVYDEIGYWNRALSATDVAKLYNSGAALPFGSFT